MQGEGDQAKLEIRIEADKEAGTITIQDTVCTPVSRTRHSQTA